MKPTPASLRALTFVAVFSVMLIPIIGEAKFMRGESVPVDRLIHNLEVVVKGEPNNIEATYTLGRLHSLAFAEGSKDVEMYTHSFEDKSLLKTPLFAPYSTPKQVQDAEGKKNPKSALFHLSETLRLYRKSVEKAPNNGLYWFSFAWILEQGAPFSNQIKAPFTASRTKASVAQWRSEALKYYRKAYQLNRAEDGKKSDSLRGQGIIVSSEAAEAILKSMEGRIISSVEAKEKEDLQAHLKLIRSRPMAVTPIIFPLATSNSLANLTSGSGASAFDLAGDGVKRRWEWVSPKTGILVWDPNRTGKIKSGRQLFGSATWWMFWQDGYAPLRALDDNKDGILTGKELRGISVWIDRNGNGVSDPGEVTPAAIFGIRSVGVRPDSPSGGALSAPKGIEMNNGEFLPTYDWVPKSK